MKFSSIYLIAAAATAGSAIAAPGPLHARALAFDNLFKRQSAPPLRSQDVAYLLNESAKARQSAASAAYTTSQGKTKTFKHDFWEKMSEKYKKGAKVHRLLSVGHKEGHYKDQATLENDRKRAVRGYRDAKETEKRAIADRK